MKPSDESVKKRIQRHNRNAFLFFLFIFAILQVILAILFKENWLTLEALLSIEGGSITFIILCVFVARIRLGTIDDSEASLQELAGRNKRFDTVFENTDLMVLELNLEGAVQLVSVPSGELGSNAGAVKGQSLEAVFEDATAGFLKQCFDKVLHNKEKIILNNQEVILRSGKVMRMSIHMTFVPADGSGSILCIGQDKTKEWNVLRINDLMAKFNALFRSDISSNLYFDRLLRELLVTFPTVEAAHLLLGEGDGPLRVKAHTGYLLESAKTYSIALKESLFFRHCGNCFGKSIILEGQLLENANVEADRLENIQGIAMRSLLSCPVYADGKLVGLLNLEASKDKAFKVSDLELMDFIVSQVSRIVSMTQWIDQGLYHSKYDQLTGLFNRWQLDEFERNTLPHCVRYKESFLFVSMTLNHLERINSQYGYQTGDLYLVTFSKLLKSCSRETDLIFRMGGDQFVAIFFTGDTFTLNGKLEGLEQSLGAHMKAAAGNEVQCSFAYGMVAFPEEGQGITEIYTLADQRMRLKELEMQTDVRYNT